MTQRVNIGRERGDVRPEREAPPRRGGGRAETVRWTVRQSLLGPTLIAATARGICRLSFDEGETELRRHCPDAILVADDASLAEWTEGALAAIREPAALSGLPLDVTGTPFQQAVWRALLRIPAGETRSYAQLAAEAGRPGAVRAAGSANGANAVAVLIPCHRVVRSDGGLGGYAYGIDRKRRLLEAEGGWPRQFRMIV